MRRLSAMLLVLLVSLPLIGPLLARPAAESSLPACCRRDGSHQCSMNRRAAERARSGGWHAAAKLCPAYPQGEQALPAASGAALAPPAALLLPGLPPAEPAAFAATPAPPDRHARVFAGRGPPPATR